jgi:protein-disulfide isomerase
MSNVRKAVVIFLACWALTACGGQPKKEEVTASLKKIMPINFEIVAIAPVSGISGLFEVQVKADKQPLVLYVNKNANLVVSGSIVDINSKQNLTLEAQKKLAGK